MIAWWLFLAALGSFKDEQLKAPRVKAAADKHDAKLREKLTGLGIDYPPHGLLLRVFKHDRELEVWAPAKGVYKLVQAVPICASSGGPGPKRQQGDGQVPEGFYNISGFNPFSSYHLSMHVDYPNASDKKRGKRDLGGDIMIHGDCVTIGCVPLQAEIEWVYWLAVRAHDAGGPVAVHMLPFKMTDAGWQAAEARWPDSPHWPFWRELRPGFDAFERNHRLPHVRVGADGVYVVTEGVVH